VEEVKEIEVVLELKFRNLSIKDTGGEGTGSEKWEVDEDFCESERETNSQESSLSEGFFCSRTFFFGESAR
jgi:hypothetical protein